jgi:SAM-dependent methyltransferase
MALAKTYRPVVLKLLACSRAKTVLDAPTGGGWLQAGLTYAPEIDGVDLYAGTPQGYRQFRVHDLDRGLPADLPHYEAVVCCEGIEHLTNPGLLLDSAYAHLTDGGLLVITTPNVWFPAGKLKYLLGGFFPSFPCLVGQIQRGRHMHLTPWSFPQLYAFLRLSGFHDIQVHPPQERTPRHFFERLLGFPQQLSCRRKLRRAASPEEAAFWKEAGSDASIYGRRLIVSARKPVRLREAA